MDYKTGEEAQESCLQPEVEDTQKRNSSRVECDRSLLGTPSASNLSCQTSDKQQQTDELEASPNPSSEHEEERIKVTEQEKEEGTEDENETHNELEVEKEAELDIESETGRPEYNEEGTEQEQVTEEREEESEGNEESEDDYEEETEASHETEDVNEDDIEKEIEHFPKIHHDGFESETESEISLHVPRVTIAERIRQLSSESQLSLKAWQDADKRKLRGQINATRSHPNCFSQNHLQNVTSSRTVGRYKQGETIPSAGVRTLIFWSNERERSNDAAENSNRSQLWASSMNMHSRQGRPIRNLQSVHGCSVRKADRPQSHEFCSCNRFVDHHNAYFHSLQQKARTATFPGFHIFQTELDEDDEFSFPRNPNLSPKLEVGGFGSKRNNTPVVPFRRHRTNLSPKQSYNSFQGYNFGRGYPPNSRSRDSFSLRSSSWETSTYSPPQVSPRHPPMPSILSLKSRKPSSKPLEKSFNDMIRGTGNFVFNETL